MLLPPALPACARPAPALAPLAQVIWGLATLVTLANYGINLRPLLASLGASSLVIGIAAQNLLRNLAAGITLVSGAGWSMGRGGAGWGEAGRCGVAWGGAGQGGVRPLCSAALA